MRSVLTTSQVGYTLVRMQPIKSPSVAGTRLSTKIAVMGITKVQAAKLINVDRSCLYRWLSGERMPQIEFASRIEKVFSIPSRLWAVERRAA